MDTTEILVKGFGGFVIFIGVVEVFTGAAWEKTGLVYRSERPFIYWLSVICKIVVGIAILNINYLRARFGG